jgi:large subunit ribosomal protein L13
MTGTNTVKTYSPRPRDIERRWYVVDADGAVLGRLASEVAKILRGKHKPIFAPHMDTGDHVIVLNAGLVRVTGGKEEKKVYVRHSGYPGGLNRIAFSRMLSKRPVRVVEKAITGMLPKNRLGRQMARKLAVYEGSEHPHQAQKPVSLSLGEIPKWEGLPKPKPQPQRRAEPAPAPKAPRGKEEPTRRARTAAEAKPAAAAQTRRVSTKSPKKSRAASTPGTSRKKSATSTKAKTAAGKAETKSTRAKAGKSESAEAKATSTRRSRGRKKSEKES